MDMQLEQLEFSGTKIFMNGHIVSKSQIDP